jgi:hypothetical protein
MTYLDEENFDYETQAERNIKQLMSAGESFYDDQQSKELLNRLRDSVNRKKDELLEENRGFIEAKLLEEWIAQSGTIEEQAQYSLQYDLMILEAIQLFENSESYDSILKQ